jgi:hypothetical protein
MIEKYNLNTPMEKGLKIFSKKFGVKRRNQTIDTKMDETLFFEELSQCFDINKTFYKTAFKISTEIHETYTKLTHKIYQLGTIFAKISASFKEIEKLAKNVDVKNSPKGPRMSLADCYDSLKDSLYYWSSLTSKRCRGVNMYLKPYCEKHLSNIKDMSTVTFFCLQNFF